jgi:hypothetical protein
MELHAMPTHIHDFTKEQLFDHRPLLAQAERALAALQDYEAQAKLMGSRNAVPYLSLVNLEFQLQRTEEELEKCAPTEGPEDRLVTGIRQLSTTQAAAMECLRVAFRALRQASKIDQNKSVTVREMFDHWQH